MTPFLQLGFTGNLFPENTRVTKQENSENQSTYMDLQRSFQQAEQEGEGFLPLRPLALLTDVFAEGGDDQRKWSANRLKKGQMKTGEES